jgi:hypothetical protein
MSVVLISDNLMTFKTILDCSLCPHLTECDAHISGGTYHYEEESDPCGLDISQT